MTPVVESTTQLSSILCFRERRIKGRLSLWMCLILFNRRPVANRGPCAPFAVVSTYRVRIALALVAADCHSEYCMH